MNNAEEIGQLMLNMLEGMQELTPTPVEESVRFIVLDSNHQHDRVKGLEDSGYRFAFIQEHVAVFTKELN